MPSLGRVMPVISLFIVLLPSQSFILTRFLHANRYPLRSKTLCLVARRAFLGVTVAIILEHLLDNLGLEFAIGAFGDLGQVEILNRISVGIEFDTAVQRSEVGLLH